MGADFISVPRLYRASRRLYVPVEHLMSRLSIGLLSSYYIDSTILPKVDLASSSDSTTRDQMVLRTKDAGLQR